MATRTEAQKLARLAKNQDVSERAKIRKQANEWYRKVQGTTLWKKRLAKKRARGKAWRSENAATLADKARVWHETHKSHRHKMGSAQHLKKKYGLTPEAFEQMRAAQGGRCAICGDALKPGKSTQVDHCHKSGQIRAILCMRCNVGLGLFRDNAKNLQVAIDYLNRHSKI